MPILRPSPELHKSVEQDWEVVETVTPFANVDTDVVADCLQPREMVTDKPWMTSTKHFDWINEQNTENDFDQDIRSRSIGKRNI